MLGHSFKPAVQIWLFLFMYNKEVAKTGAKCPFFLKFMSCKKANMENLFGHTVVDIICDVTVC